MLLIVDIVPEVVLVSNAQGYGFHPSFDKVIGAYISKNKNIRDVLISGGDPLMLPRSKNSGFSFSRLAIIEHVEFVRDGAHDIPVFVPQRITTSPLLEALPGSPHPLAQYSC